jgi:hypothetical protein
MRDLDERVFMFSCRIVDVFNLLQKGCPAGRALSYQLLDAGTSIGANYEEVVAKQLLRPNEVCQDISEARQITAILTAIIRKARQSPDRGPGS